MQEFKRTRRLEEDDDEDTPVIDKYLGYNTKYKQQVCLSIPIDEPFREAGYYRHVAKAIADTDEGDQVEFEISSPGGYLNGLIALLTAMEKTPAITVAHINGECHSAASMLALNCDVVSVSPYSTMLVHFVRFGSSGKGTDVVSQVSHIFDTAKQLFENTYEHFLTKEEMQKCVDGLELWLNSDDIQARLKRKYDALDKEAKKTKKVAKTVAEK